VLFGGKGGVGKTTCAAAYALAFAAKHPKKRVLLLSTDPAQSLADVLGVPLGDEAQRTCGVFARELDANAAFRGERDRYRDAVDDLFDALLGGSRFDATFDRVVVRDLIDLAPPGLDELFATLALVDALTPRDRKARPYDLVVVDTAPTGHTLRLLAMPKDALEWVHALLEILLKYRKVIGLGDLAGDLVTLAKKLRELETLLHDPSRARFVAVTRAAELPRLETARLVRALDRMRVPVGGVIVNAVTHGTCTRCARAAATESREIQRIAELRHAMLLAPAAYPPPRGEDAIRRWGARWMSIE
jgi:arsenite-transporting ATPase